MDVAHQLFVPRLEVWAFSLRERPAGGVSARILKMASDGAVSGVSFAVSFARHLPNSTKCLILMVRAEGIEPPTLWV